MDAIFRYASRYEVLGLSLMMLIGWCVSRAMAQWYLNEMSWDEEDERSMRSVLRWSIACLLLAYGGVVAHRWIADTEPRTTIDRSLLRDQIRDYDRQIHQSSDGGTTSQGDRK